MFGSPLGFIAPAPTAVPKDYTAFWLFDEGSGATLGDQTGNYPGTISNCTWDTVVKPAGAAASLDFDRASASKVLISPMLPEVGDFALSFWIYWTTGIYDLVMAWGTTISSAPIQMIRTEASGSDRKVGVATWSPWAPATPATTLAASAWHHVVINWASGTNNLEIFFNNVSVHNGTLAPQTSGHDTFTIGGKQAGAYVPEFTGKLSCMSYYQRALTAPEIALMTADPTYAP